MIQLALTRVQMLADIGAREEDLGALALDPGDPGLVKREQVRLVARAHHREELYGCLEPALRRRFRRVSSETLANDLLLPLRKAIGNAHRRGNLEDPAKWLTAEIVATRRGAVLTVTDEGAGFDVERVVRQFEHEERYFTREGHGIAWFARTSSLVSYADGGRTWLMRFRCDPAPGRAVKEDERAAFGPAGDAEFMKTFLARQLPCFRDHGVSLDSCRVYAGPRAQDAGELAYVLGLRGRDRTGETMVLTGRVLPEAAARADVSMAERLRESWAGASEGLHVSRPLGAFGEPSLSLFHLDPSVTFRERMKKIRGLGPLALVLRFIAVGLAAIHLSTVKPEAQESLGDIVERHRAAKARVEARLPDGGSRKRAGACFEELLERSEHLAPCEPAPIHGALTWDCIVASRERWELYRFDKSRLSHPGLDVGAFLADLRRFNLLRDRGDPRLHTATRAVFLEGYCRGPRPPWIRDLEWFEAGALLAHLDRMLQRADTDLWPKVDPLLEQVERLLHV